MPVIAKESNVAPTMGGGVLDPKYKTKIHRSVVFIIANGTCGTGSIVDYKNSPPWLLTSHHVISSEKTAKNCKIYFDWEGSAKPGRCFYGHKLFDTSRPFITWPSPVGSKSQEPEDLELDCSLIPLKASAIPDKRDYLSLDQYLDLGSHALKEEDQVYLVHYPAMSDNKFLRQENSYRVKFLEGYLIGHQAETDGGSSGCPVLKEVDHKLVLVGMHTGAMDEWLIGVKLKQEINVATNVEEIHKLCTTPKAEYTLPAIDELKVQTTLQKDEPRIKALRETLCDNPHIQSLERRVKEYYKILKPSESKVRVEYVQLALLEAQPYTQNEDKEDMMELKKGGGNKLDFPESFRLCGLKKVRGLVDIADLLKPATSDADNRMKVVYGQAGIGKTTMLTHICRSLTLPDKPMQSSYALVLYFPLWNKAVSSAKNLSDLLSYYTSAKSLRSAVEQAIEDNSGKEVLFIFDGANEVQDLLSSEERGVFQEILEGRTLPQADVIVSSRPGGLSHLMKQNVSDVYYEIHGLPELSIKKYIKDFFKFRPEKGEYLWKELQSHVDLMGAAHIPMNLLIFCTIFSKEGLPSTLTDCYKQLIVKAHNRESLENTWNCFDRCPEDVKQLLHSLGRLAYNGLMSTPSTFVFEEEDVKEAFETTSLDKSTFKGLLHEHLSIFEVYSNSTFNFSHTTQQELFCAYYISHLSVEKQIEFLRGNFLNHKYFMVLRFYAGLTRLADVPIVFHKLGFFDDPFLPKASTTDLSISAPYCRLLCNNANPGLLHLFHFLYESQNAILTQSVARQLDGKSILFSLSLTSNDTRVIAHCLRECNFFNRLSFCQDSNASEHVLSCVSSILKSDLVTEIQELALTVNRLTQTSGFLLKEGLSRIAVEELDLNLTRTDMSAIAAVFEATGVKRLKLTVFNEAVGSVSDSDHKVAQSSARNTRIKDLRMVYSPSLLLLPVVKGLAANTCVEKLFLWNVEGFDDGDGSLSVGQALATACGTNTTLKDIELIGVCPFPLMKVLSSREVPLERLHIRWRSLSEDSSPCTLETLAQNMKVKKFEANNWEWSTEYLKAFADGLSRNKSLKEVGLRLRSDVPDDVKDSISVKLSTLEKVNVCRFF